MALFSILPLETSFLGFCFWFILLWSISLIMDQVPSLAPNKLRAKLWPTPTYSLFKNRSISSSMELLLPSFSKLFYLTILLQSLWKMAAEINIQLYPNQNNLIIFKDYE